MQMEESFEKKIWDTLSSINVNDKIEKKNGLTYLSWAWAWGVLMKHYPQSTYIINSPAIELDGSMTVSVTLTIKEDKNEATRFMWLPVMDFKNHAIKNPNSVDINKATMRCLTKAISMFGLGFYIYAGEDLPEEEKQAQKINEDELNKKRESLIKAVEQSAQKGIDAMAEFWKSLSIEDQKLIGADEKRRIYESVAKVADANGTENG
ncbi:hypothetical protein A9G09_11995 [Gilliamella sp. wkB292]|uniref:Sak single strand annealing protein n=1 Tax=Gilliamella sp. wkB292 TaxID=3120262 RepID=UPI00080E2370|nr:DUF1071 domain-containing protein [Gilliamella apicola]OCG10827.1 hypothetical protein A9G09_11995 [Gilliamella apicola]